jgi:nucleotide-binding universal stress UspA family protein
MKKELRISAPLVAGIDGSAHGWAVAQAAASLASALDRRLVLVHAVSDPPTFPYGDPQTRELQRRHAIERAERLLNRVAEVLPTGSVRPTVRLGDHKAALAAVAQEEEAVLLVIGSSRGPLAAARTGGVAAKLGAQTRLPVMVVPRGVSDALAATSPIGSIVCALNDSPESLHALEIARALAAPLGLELVPVFADRERRPKDVGGVVAEFGSARGAINRVVARRNGRLIVVGSRGRGPLAGALLGSVSGALAHSATVPVVIAPPGTRGDGLIHTPVGAALAGSNDAAEDLRAAA